MRRVDVASAHALYGRALAGPKMAGGARSCLWALAFWALATGHAAAHGFPTPFRLLFDANDPTRTAVLLRPGIALTESSGQAWSFVCGAIAGVAGPDAYPAVLSGGHLLIGGYVGLYRDDGHGCGWTRVASTQLPEGRVVSLYAGSGVDGASVEALVTPQGAAAARFASRDHGQTWTALTKPLPALDAQGLIRARKDAQRLYLTGVQATTKAVSVWTSSDDGDTWAEGAQLGPGCAEFLGSDPSDARRVFVRCAADVERELDAGVDGGSGLDRVLVSDDAAATFRTWAELPEIGGFAVAPDGATAWVGSRSGGLWRVDAEGSLQLMQADMHVGCVQYHDEMLWVCARDERGYDPYALATSADGGRSLTPYLHSTEVTTLQTCGNRLQAKMCSSEWDQWQYDVSFSQAEMDMSTDMSTAGGTPASGAAGSAAAAVTAATPRASTGMSAPLMAAASEPAAAMASAEPAEPVAPPAASCAAQPGRGESSGAEAWLLLGLTCWLRRRVAMGTAKRRARVEHTSA